MRQTQNENLPDSMTVIVATESRSALGTDEEWEESSPVACRLAPLTGAAENEVGNEVLERSAYHLTFSSAASLKPSDRVKIAGLIYEVESVEDAREHQTAGRAVVRRLD